MNTWIYVYCKRDDFNSHQSLHIHRNRCPSRIQKRIRPSCIKVASTRSERDGCVNGKCASASVMSTVNAIVDQWKCNQCGRNDFASLRSFSAHKTQCCTKHQHNLRIAKVASCKKGGHSYGRGASVSSTFSHTTNRTKMNSDNQKKQDRGVTYYMDALRARKNLWQQASQKLHLWSPV